MWPGLMPTRLLTSAMRKPAMPRSAMASIAAFRIFSRESMRGMLGMLTRDGGVTACLPE